MKRSNLNRRSRLRPVSVRKALRREQDAIENAESNVAQPLHLITPKRRAVSPASPGQRAKVRDTGCRNCGLHPVQPVHVVDRSLGGCDSPLCVLSLCPTCHRLYDEGTPGLDILPLLSLDEQAHAVGHVGIERARRRLTNTRPELGPNVRY